MYISIRRQRALANKLYGRHPVESQPTAEIATLRKDVADLRREVADLRKDRKPVEMKATVSIDGDLRATIDEMKKSIEALENAAPAPVVPIDPLNLAAEGRIEGDKLGATVEWSSSNQTKRGVVMSVVPAGKLPGDVNVKIKDAITPRDHESYIVRGHPIASWRGEKTGDNATYWPRVSLLVFI